VHSQRIKDEENNKRVVSELPTASISSPKKSAGQSKISVGNAELATRLQVKENIITVSRRFAKFWRSATAYSPKAALVLAILW